MKLNCLTADIYLPIVRGILREREAVYASAEGANSHNRSGMLNRRNIVPTGERPRRRILRALVHRRGRLRPEPKLSGKRTAGEARRIRNGACPASIRSLPRLYPLLPSASIPPPLPMLGGSTC